MTLKSLCNKLQRLSPTSPVAPPMKLPQINFCFVWWLYGDLVLHFALCITTFEHANHQNRQCFPMAANWNLFKFDMSRLLCCLSHKTPWISINLPIQSKLHGIIHLLLCLSVCLSESNYVQMASTLFTPALLWCTSCNDPAMNAKFLDMICIKKMAGPFEQANHTRTHRQRQGTFQPSVGLFGFRPGKRSGHWIVTAWVPSAWSACWEGVDLMWHDATLLCSDWLSSFLCPAQKHRTRKSTCVRVP